MTSPINLAKKVQRTSDRLEEASERGLGEGMAKTKQHVKREIRFNDSDVTGNLMDSIRMERFKSDSTDAVAELQVSINQQYAPFVEYGTGSRQAGFLAASSKAKFKSPDPAPPLGKIMQYVIQKGIIATNSMADLARKNRVQEDTFTDSQGNTVTVTPEQRLLAYAIRDSIAEYGNRPHPFARPAAQVGFTDTRFEVRDELRDALSRF